MPVQVATILQDLNIVSTDTPEDGLQQEPIFTTLGLSNANGTDQTSTATVKNASSTRVKSSKRVAPSPLLKAYAYTLRNHLTIQNDVTQASQAIFLANSMHLGIPIGVDEGFINQAIYMKADAVQSGESYEFTQGRGSFIDWLAEYLENVEDVSNSST